VRQNPYGEKFDKPAVIIANHQSFIDILLLLSTTPKVVMVTNSWVWNSPFFGWIVKYADFHHSADGYEALAERVQERVNEGYSVIVFPEGTRCRRGKMGHFKKGAFVIANMAQKPVLPITIDGAYNILPKGCKCIHWSPVTLTFHALIECKGRDSESVEQMMEDAYNAVASALKK
jgi:1-acyl-sn-glycerol-3-phosphate acyltransferase